MHNKRQIAIEGLKLLESQQGRLRLDIAPYYPNLDEKVLEDSWRRDQSLFEDWFPDAIDPYREYREFMKPIAIPMFDDPWMQAIKGNIKRLLGSRWDQLCDIPVANMSIPVLNASAVNFGHSSYGIAMNSRLSTQLTPVNCLMVMIEYKSRNCQMDKPPSKDIGIYRNNIIEILRCTGPELFDTISKAEPYESAFFYWFGIRHALLQYLFIILHEYSHIINGHLQNKDVWLGHPLSSPDYSFFNNSQLMEQEADATALRLILDPENLANLPEPWNVPGGNPNLIANSIVLLFIWFSIIVGSDKEGYYKVPRSHPHPADRIRLVESIISEYPKYYSVEKFRGSVNNQMNFYIPKY